MLGINLSHLLLLPPPSLPQQTDPTIQSIVNLHGMLECCQFKNFWQAMEDVEETVEQVPVFKQAIRKCELHVL